MKLSTLASTALAAALALGAAAVRACHFILRPGGGHTPDLSWQPATQAFKAHVRFLHEAGYRFPREYPL